VLAAIVLRVRRLPDPAAESGAAVGVTLGCRRVPDRRAVATFSEQVHNTAESTPGAVDSVTGAAVRLPTTFLRAPYRRRERPEQHAVPGGGIGSLTIG
jgi:hypothetical protein